MTNITENSSSSLIGSLGHFSDQILVIIIILNFVSTIFCLLKCFQILSRINPKKSEKFLSSAINLSSPMAKTELNVSEIISSETQNSDELLIDRAIKSIRSGFTLAQLSEKLDIEPDYLKILHRVYQQKLD